MTPNDWPSRRQSALMMWRYRKAWRVVDLRHLPQFVFELIRGRRSDWSVWARRFRAGCALFVTVTPLAVAREQRDSLLGEIEAHRRAVRRSRSRAEWASANEALYETAASIENEVEEHEGW